MKKRNGHLKIALVKIGLAIVLVVSWIGRGASLLLAQSGAASTGSAGASTGASAAALEIARPFRLEVSSFDNNVSNGFGHWWGGGVDLRWQPNARVIASASFVSQRRPGANGASDVEQLGGARAIVNWSKWFYTDTSVNGGGRDDPAAFFPRLRYDLTANFKLPMMPQLILTGGITQLYFGAPNSGSIGRAGAIYYWRRFVFQGNLNFNTAQPGGHRSKSANGAVQYGQEGRYWVGVASGGGREAWQTLALTPQDVEFQSYSASAFLRKWLAPSYGVAVSYGYTLKRTAYRINAVEAKFFWDF